ncbi:hypothetical protein MMC31_006752 [Peltigera leucophlebia]|nr:hypothetical protein [Peltigera leucophlebia]
MHFTALLTLVALLIPAVIPVPAPSPQSAEIDIHLELNSKDLAGVFNEREAKTNPHNNADAPNVPNLPYPFFLKGNLTQGLEIIGPLPPLPYYYFPEVRLGEQGIISVNATVFRLQGGKLRVGDFAVGLSRPFVEKPVPAVLVPPQNGLNFIAEHPLGSDKIFVRFVDRTFTFLGPKFVSNIGDGVEVGRQPVEETWAGTSVRTSANKVSFEDYDQDVFAEDYDQDVSAEI